MTESKNECFQKTENDNNFHFHGQHPNFVLAFSETSDKLTEHEEKLFDDLVSENKLKYVASECDWNSHASVYFLKRQVKLCTPSARRSNCLQRYLAIILFATSDAI